MSSFIALALLLVPASARAIWNPEEFYPGGSNFLQTRQADTCGGDSSLSYCGGDLPSGFCCSSSYTCLALQTDASVQAAICCPVGAKCDIVGPISCDISLQNTTTTQLHADPPQQLKTCGSACCPMGYDCNSGQCVARFAPSPPTKKPTSTKTTSHTTTASRTTSTGAVQSSTTASTTSSTTPVPHANQHPAATETGQPSAGHGFSGKSFATGFLPGIVLGALITTCIVILYIRKRRGGSDSYVDEKKHARDTLTDLGPMEYRRPYMHGRSISEPVTDPSAGHRTDFLRSTPPRGIDGNGMVTNGYVVDARSPASGPKTPGQSPPRVKAFFSHSPFMSQYPSTPPSTQAPIPAHMKRGTLSFKISPVRALKKQKSMHSLRRQVIDGTAGTTVNRNDSRRDVRPDLSRSRSGSTETIQVLMPSNEPYTPPQQTPDHIQTLASATYQPPSSSTPSSWGTADTTSSSSPHPQVTYASSSGYPSDVQGVYTTPTRPPVPRVPTDLSLGSPYTPTNQLANGRGKPAAGGGFVASGSGRGLGVERSASRRDTTFSAMMERAGLRKSDFLVGGK